MRYPLIAVAIVAVVFATFGIYEMRTGARGVPAVATADAGRVQSIATGLRAVWSLAFAPDGRMFVAERPGQIRIIEHDKLADAPWASVPVYASQAFESGLMGMAIDPNFAENKRVFICFTQHAAFGLPTANSIAVLTEVEGKGTALTVIVDNIVAGPYHDGCRLKFGPDGKLYASTGDAAPNGDRSRGGRAQSLMSLNGKILRINPDGSIPADNPFPHSYVWSYGHRNVQGLAFQEETGKLFATEHGTGTVGHGNNELNVIEAGKNYGWPKVVGEESHEGYAAPILVNDDPPAGATFVTSDRYPALRGTLLIGTLGSHRLLSVVFKPGPAIEVLRTDILIDQSLGRIRDVIQGPDGYIYLATSNRDGRARSGALDDQVFRLLR